jgi:hypothetical protein
MLVRELNYLSSIIIFIQLFIVLFFYSFAYVFVLFVQYSEIFSKRTVLKKIVFTLRPSTYRFKNNSYPVQVIPLYPPDLTRPNLY